MYWKVGEYLSKESENVTFGDEFVSALLTQINWTNHLSFRVQVGGEDFRIDLLFFHRGLQCLVAFELKIGKFKPEYISKMDFYLEALDRQKKKENENPSVGMILCASKDDEVVEYAMSRTMSPMMVAEYQLQLPDKAVLQKGVSLMAKRRRKGKRKSTKCPEPFNTLIDLLAGAIMNMIANRMERKYHYRKRGVLNPYRASAIGLSTGRLRKTEDIIRLGGFLGAMGAFDPDDTETNPDTYTPKTSRIPKSNTTWKSEKTSVSSSAESNNKYAWRMNCQDGSAHGIYPEDYETMEAYNKALFDAFVIDDIDENEDTEVPYMFEDTIQKDEGKIDKAEEQE